MVKCNFCTRKHRRAKSESEVGDVTSTSHQPGLVRAVASRMHLSQTGAAEQRPERGGGKAGTQEDRLNLEPSRQSRLRCRKLTATAVAPASEAVSVSGQQ